MYFSRITRALIVAAGVAVLILAVVLFTRHCTRSEQASGPSDEPTVAEETTSPTEDDESPAPSDGDESAPARESPSSASATPTDPEWSVGDPDGPENLPGDEGPAKAAPGDGKAASKRAKATVTALLDTKVKEKKWWPRVKKQMTPEAQEVWKYTDPERVPKAKVNGAVKVEAVSATDAEVTVPTSIGDWSLVLVRDDPKDKWLVSAMTPPEEGQ